MKQNIIYILIWLLSGSFAWAANRIELTTPPLAGESVGDSGYRILWEAEQIDSAPDQYVSTSTTSTTTSTLAEEARVEIASPPSMPATTTSTVVAPPSTSTTTATTTSTTIPATTSTIKSTTTTVKLTPTTTTAITTTSTTKTTAASTTTSTTTTTQAGKENRSKERAQQEGLERITDSPLTYPSPFSPANHRDGVKIQYTLSASLDVDIFIYSSAGQLIKKLYCPNGSTGGSEGLNKVPWDGNLDTGGRIGNGTYVGTIISKKDNHLLGKFKLNVFD